ncbi:MAG TPA: hypothetical protein VNM22_22340 [Candidatus Limnocylindrales bacterium]|nr:hypothetical protein [Candidatus Limnocylindrales bacterium]
MKDQKVYRFLKRWVSCRVGGVIVFFNILSYPAFAVTILPMSLVEMIDRADKIFVGICLSVQPDSIILEQTPLPVTTYTFEVIEPLKGTLPKKITFSQVGVNASSDLAISQSIPGKPVRIPFHIPGMPTYHPGEEVLLFLSGESRIGLTSPVGLLQGAFFARKDKISGKKFLVNGIQNAGLMPGHEGPWPFEDLLAQIRANLKK